jgi:peptide-methionine (S)-S-oxide reductase
MTRAVTSFVAMLTGMLLLGAAPDTKLARATFAAGCFWCAEAAFEPIPGVVSVTSGYAGGTEQNPTYALVSSGRTGHAESVQVLYDPAKVTYEQLLDIFWHNIDPVTADSQFCDHGHQYRSAVFYENDEQKAAAEASKKKIEAGRHFKDPIKTQIAPVIRFWPAEEYHQDFYKKNPVRYKAYRQGCQRDRRLQEVWGDEAGKHQ